MDKNMKAVVNALNSNAGCMIACLYLHKRFGLSDWANYFKSHKSRIKKVRGLQNTTQMFNLLVEFKKAGLLEKLPCRKHGAIPYQLNPSIFGPSSMRITSRDRILNLIIAISHKDLARPLSVIESASQKLDYLFFVNYYKLLLTAIRLWMNLYREHSMLDVNVAEGAGWVNLNKKLNYFEREKLRVLYASDLLDFSKLKKGGYLLPSFGEIHREMQDIDELLLSLTVGKISEQARLQ